jgi:hypothetical protein
MHKPAANPWRPREHDRDQIAYDLIEWAKKDDSINLNKFCALNGIPPSKLSLWSKEEDNFRQAYELAKSFIGFRREEKLNSEELHIKAYDLNAATYDYFLKEERRQQAEYVAGLKTQIDISVDEKIIENYKLMMNQLDKLQSSARSMEDSNINSEQKS